MAAFGTARARKAVGRDAALQVAAELPLDIGRDGVILPGASQEVFFALSFDGHTPRGAVAFHAGFNADGQQGAEEGAANRVP